MAYGGLHLLRGAMPDEGGYGEIPHSELIGINGPVLAFTLVVSLVTGIVFGLAPAIQISRSELYESLKEGSRGSTGGRRSYYVRSALVVSEVALSLVLLVGAGLLIRSFVLLISEDLGFNPSHVLTMQLWLPESHYAEGQPVVNFYQQVIDRVAALPGVKAAERREFSAVERLDRLLRFRHRGPRDPAFWRTFHGTVPHRRFAVSQRYWDPPKEGARS